MNTEMVKMTKKQYMEHLISKLVVGCYGYNALDENDIIEVEIPVYTHPEKIETIDAKHFDFSPLPSEVKPEK